MRDHVQYRIDGVTYRWSGWFGCQLESLEWFRPPAGTKRRVAGFVMTIWRTERRGLKVCCNWALEPSDNIDVHARRIYDLQDILRKL
jgi:hypothetical protein